MALAGRRLLSKLWRGFRDLSDCPGSFPSAGRGPAGVKSGHWVVTRTSAPPPPLVDLCEDKADGMRLCPAACALAGPFSA